MCFLKQNPFLRIIFNLINLCISIYGLFSPSTELIQCLKVIFCFGKTTDEAAGEWLSVVET